MPKNKPYPKQNKPPKDKADKVGTTPHNKDRARANAGQIKLDKDAGQFPGKKKTSKVGVRVKKKF